ncbi:FAD binding domain-containing protein [Mesorhizobium sp. LHD-90]|uniref:FAD binding domain-containing protein n=1 Tax=Mesorhizobium sp. LHD-90 TaxID=3071414 RepID=UPI0027DF40E4|nr:FAD binding domain-containing protein [Mesorhizobium sp. LHD-90]MDQ6435471.1 FAD binding domain-containing protein [Mesorhizobium sp. LHD-90]
MADSVADATAALTDDGCVPLAGGTWIMRASIRGEAQSRRYVGIGRIPELNTIDVKDGEIRLGACVTHARLVESFAGLAQWNGLAAAAGAAANPAVREMATVGGNLSTQDFFAADLPPALLSLDAAVELVRPGGTERLSVGRYLDVRRTLEPGALMTSIVLPRRPMRTGHARLPLRKAGDYPVAIVSMAAVLSSDGRVDVIRIAVGSVEPAAGRWTELEEKLLGRPLDPDTAHEMAEATADTFTGRDSVEAPGWYRVKVLPALVRRATQAVLSSR